MYQLSEGLLEAVTAQCCTNRAVPYNADGVRMAPAQR